MRLVVFVTALVWASSGLTDAFDGRELRDRCDTAASSANRGFCSGYLMATAATLRSVRRYYKRKVFNVCVPEPEALDASLLVQRFLDWTHRNPDKLHHSANEVAIAALHDAFRCGGR